MSISASLPEKANPANPRLNPSRFSSRYYILSLLRNQLEVIATRHLAHRDSAVLVDFGCGSMPYRPLFEPHVRDYIGVDLPGKERAEISSARDGVTGIRSDSADVVLSTQVLEHVDDPFAYLSECWRILNPGGLLILSTHGFWRYHPDPSDFWRWTGSGIRKIVTEAKFEIRESHGLMGLAPTGAQLVSDALIPKIPRAARTLLILVAQFLMMLLDRFHSVTERNEDACVFVIVATKSRHYAY